MSEERGASGLSEAARLGLFAAIAGALLLSIAVLIEVGGSAGVVCLTSTAALVALSLPLWLRRRVPLVEPLWLVLLNVAVGTTGTALFIALGPPDPVRFLLLDMTARDLVSPALVIALGMLCFALGYICVGGRRHPAATRAVAATWNDRRFTLTVGALLLLGLISFAVFVARLDITIDSLSDLSSKRFIEQGAGGLAVRGYLRWGARLTQIALLLVFARWLAAEGRLRWQTAIAVGLLALLAVAFPVFVSSRQDMMLLVLRLLLIWICIRGEPPLRWVLPAAAVALVLLGSMQAWRRDNSSWGEFGGFLAPRALIEQTVGGRSYLDLTKTAHIMAAVPETGGYRYGETLITWLLAPVPRSWWPAKPPIGVGATIGAQALETPRGSGVPPGIVAELYLNFGLAGVLCGLFAFGLLLRRLHTGLGSYFPHPGFVVVYAVLSTRLALDMVYNEISPAISRLLQELLPLLAALWLLRQRRRPPHRA